MAVQCEVVSLTKTPAGLGLVLDPPVVAQGAVILTSSGVDT